MVWSTEQTTVWQLAAKQHGVISRFQLGELGLSRRAVEHRIAIGRLHPLTRGIYAVGRPEVSRHGKWMAAVLSCDPRFGSHADTPGISVGLSHVTAAALWGIVNDARGPIELTTVGSAPVRRPGLRVHRRLSLPPERFVLRKRIPVTDLVQTLVDLAAALNGPALERTINEADRLDLIDPEALRAQLPEHGGEPGVVRLRSRLDRHIFRLTDSELERRFMALVRQAGLPPPLTQQWLNGYRVDFYWPRLGLVVETDGLRYHRTPTAQSRDLRRDRAHVVAGMSRLRFTHWEVVHEAVEVVRTLSGVMAKLRT